MAGPVEAQLAQILSTRMPPQDKGEQQRIATKIYEVLNSPASSVEDKAAAQRFLDQHGSRLSGVFARNTLPFGGEAMANSMFGRDEMAFGDALTKTTDPVGFTGANLAGQAAGAVLPAMGAVKGIRALSGLLSGARGASKLPDVGPQPIGSGRQQSTLEGLSQQQPSQQRLPNSDPAAFSPTQTSQGSGRPQTMLEPQSSPGGQSAPVDPLSPLPPKSPSTTVRQGRTQDKSGNWRDEQGRFTTRPESGADITAGFEGIPGRNDMIKQDQLRGLIRELTRK